MSDDYPKVNYPDFSNSKVVTSMYCAKLYSVPHDLVVQHLEMLYDLIEKMVEEEDMDRNGWLATHGIYPTVRNGVKYFELNRKGFEHFTQHAIGRRSGKWQSMYLWFMGMEFGKYRPPDISPSDYA